jgi:menaquinone-dependent protoporphyrinogen IX oxidase
LKTLILFRSYYGNTKQVADVIAQQMKSAGHEVDIRDVRVGLPDLDDIDAIVLGAPTRRGRVTRKALNVLSTLKQRGYGDKPVAVFDTISFAPPTPLGSLLLVSRSREDTENAKKWLEPGAIGIMMKKAREHKLNLFPELLRCEVIDTRGPLAENATREAVAFANAFILFAQKR